jgi:uncharacterized protein (UPF0276 family)
VNAAPSAAVLPEPIPARAGVGLRGPHQAEFLEGTPRVSWLEAHSENYFSADGVAAQTLERIREHYPLSLHGVGLGLGSVAPLDTNHLAALQRLVARMEPGLVSEHLCWGSVDDVYLNDLLPLPYTEEAAQHAARRIDQVQTVLQRQILIENISGYVEFTSSTMPEWEFLESVAKRSGARILLDVNNIYVNACNHGFSADRYIESIAPELVAEIHLAGHSLQNYDGHDILVDTHDAAVAPAVWSLFETALGRFGAVPTLIEWDAALPSVATLLGEAAKAQQRMDTANDCLA